MLFTSTENGVEDVGGVVTGGRVKGGKVNEGRDLPPGETRTRTVTLSLYMCNNMNIQPLVENNVGNSFLTSYFIFFLHTCTNSHST